MAVFRRLYQPLWYRNCKFHTGVCRLTNPIINTRKAIPLNVVIANNADIYNDIVKENLSNTKWHDIRERILQSQHITMATVDCTVIDMCLKHFHVDKAIAYFKFLRENNYPLNIAIIGKYLRLYVLKNDELTEADRMEIVNTYDNLRKKHPYLDAITAEHCIISLCLTDEWKRIYELIDMMKTTSVPGVSVYSGLAGAAFRNGESSVAWEALSQIVSRKQIPQDIAFKSYLQFCEREDERTFNDKIEEMFAFWSENSIMPYNRVINAYADVAGKYGWSATATSISKTGRCKHCCHILSEITISEKSFQTLVESVMNKVIIGPDIYHKSNPRELQKFKEFVEKTKPYDIVIDGLNMTYFQRTSRPLFQTLVRVVNYFNTRGKKMLILTRKHQNKLPILKDIQQYASVFTIDDLSMDDPYILYATMASGENAMFVSMDLMRQHKHSLQELRLQQDFKKWQCSHQYFVRTRGPQDVHIQEPFVYMPIAHKNNDHWHIPYVSDDSTYAHSYDFPDKWYCFKYNGGK